MGKKIYFGVLILVILSASFYILLPDKIRIDVQNTKTLFSVYEEDKFVLSATEYVNLFDGTKKMRAKSRSIEQRIDGDMLIIKRLSLWKDNITTITEYKFMKDISDVELIPIKATTTCINCEGKILHFEYRDISYDGETKKIKSPFSFGHNMKLEWQDGAYFSKVYQQKVSDKIIIKYRPTTDYEMFNVRMFDPMYGGLNITLGGNFTFAPNWSKTVYTNTTVGDWYETGNFTINITEYNITTYPSLTYTFNISNTNTTHNVTVLMKINESMSYSNWYCNRVNLTTTFGSIINVTNSSYELINCTLDLLNAFQEYENWSLINNNMSLNFTYDFNSTII